MKYYIFDSQSDAMMAIQQLQSLATKANYQRYKFNELRLMSTGMVALFVPEESYPSSIESELATFQEIEHWWEGTKQEAIDIKNQELYAVFSQLITDLTSRYSPEEREQFPVLEAEANAYDGTDASAPTIAQIAEIRGVSTASYVDVIRVKSLELRTRRNQLIGLRGKITDSLPGLSIKQIVDYDWQAEVNALPHPG